MKKNKAIKTKNPYIKLPSLVQKHLKKKKKEKKKWTYLSQTIT